RQYLAGRDIERHQVPSNGMRDVGVIYEHAAGVERAPAREQTTHGSAELRTPEQGARVRIPGGDAFARVGAVPPKTLRDRAPRDDQTRADAHVRAVGPVPEVRGCLGPGRGIDRLEVAIEHALGSPGA